MKLRSTHTQNGGKWEVVVCFWVCYSICCCIVNTNINKRIVNIYYLLLQEMVQGNKRVLCTPVQGNKWVLQFPKSCGFLFCMLYNMMGVYRGSVCNYNPK